MRSSAYPRFRRSRYACRLPNAFVHWHGCELRCLVSHHGSLRGEEQAATSELELPYAIHVFKLNRTQSDMGLYTPCCTIASLVGSSRFTNGF